MGLVDSMYTGIIDSLKYIRDFDQIFRESEQNYVPIKKEKVYVENDEKQTHKSPDNDGNLESKRRRSI